MAELEINSKEFFSNYIFHPFKKELSREDQLKAFVTSVALAIITLGLFHVCCHLKYPEPISINKKSDLHTRVTKLADSQNIIDSNKQSVKDEGAPVTSAKINTENSKREDILFNNSKHNKKTFETKFTYAPRREKLHNVDINNSSTAAVDKEYIDAKFAYEAARRDRLANADTYNNYIKAADNAKEYLDAKFAYEAARSDRLANADTYNNYIKAADNAKKEIDAKQAEYDKKFFLEAQKSEALNILSSPNGIAPVVKEKVVKSKSTPETPVQSNLINEDKFSPHPDVKQLYSQFKIPSDKEQIEAQRISFAKLNTKIVCLFLEGKITSREFLLDYLSQEQRNALDFTKIPLENIEILFTPALLDPYSNLIQVVDLAITIEHKQQNSELFNKFKPDQQIVIKNRLGSKFNEYFL